MTDVDLEKLAKGINDAKWSIYFSDSEKAAIAEALRLKARLGWLWQSPDGQIYQTYAGEYKATRDGLTVFAATPLAAIDALKAVVEPQPAPELPPKCEHKRWMAWGASFSNDGEFDHYFRFCRDCDVTESATALVPASIPPCACCDSLSTHRDSDGFERWNVCGVCGGIRIDCFCCGSVSRLGPCTCRHDRTH